MREIPFPDTFAILPSCQHVFDHEQEARSLSLRVVLRRHLRNDVEVLVTNLGLLAFDFQRSNLGGYTQLQFDSDGLVPQTVMKNRDELIDLQSRRIQIAVFVSACVFGYFAKQHNSSVVGARFPGLDEIFNYGELSKNELGLPESDRLRLEQLLWKRKDLLDSKQLRHSSMNRDQLESALDLVDRLLASSDDYVVNNPVAMVDMAYQAMILHGLQHAAASIALSATVIEAAAHEAMFAYGLIKGVDPRISSSTMKAEKVSSLSKNELNKLGFNGMITELENAGLVNSYLKSRIDGVRSTRNKLMHRHGNASPGQSGEALTAVRDMLQICTAEKEFELITPWGYRI